MRYIYFAFTFLIRFNTSRAANLLLPGFQGHELQAKIFEEVCLSVHNAQGNLTNGRQARSVTTYIVTCAEGIEDCGIHGDGITAVAGPTFIELTNTNPRTYVAD